MAYAALISFKNTTEYLFNFSRLSALPASSETVDFPSTEIDFLGLILRKLDWSSRSRRVKALDGQIREALHELEDVFESFLSNLILTAQSDQIIGREISCSIYDEELRQGVDSFIETVKMIKEDYSNLGLENPLPKEELDDDDYEEEEPSRIDIGGKKSKFVGLSDELTKIKDQLLAGNKFYELGVVSFVGVAGTGRSTFAMGLFDGIDTARLFKLRAWVSIGPKYKFKEIILGILSQIDDPSGNDHKLLVSEGDEEKIFEYLYTSLKGQRYLIVLDDVWDTEVWGYLRKLFPDDNNGSRVFLTTHLQEVALFANSFSIHPTCLLNKVETWNLLSQVLFRQRNSCPPELEKAGKKIAEYCRGLHVEVARVAILLSKVDRTPEHWNKVAAEMENSVSMNAYDEMFEISKIIEDESKYLSRSDSARIIQEVLGIRKAIHDIRISVFPNVLYPYLKVVAVVGMPGIGKTALAREIFEDPSTLSCYDHRVWVTFGPKYQLERLLMDILAQLDPNIDKVPMKDDETLAKRIRSLLSCKRCLIVLDDVWKNKFCPYLGNFLPDIKFEVLLTTRLLEVPSIYFGVFSRERTHEITLLNKEDSWNLLRERLFGEKKCPRELEKAGKLIAENCDGLPLMIVTVASLLFKADEMTEEYWNEVAKKENSVFEDAYRKISKVLYPSYKNLNLENKACFLYMAAFCLKYEIPISKLFMLCTVEGILQPNYHYDSRSFESIYISTLVCKSLVLVHNKKYNGQSKTCRLHSVFWHFCVREAGIDKFLHVLNSHVDGFAEVIKKQRRLCIQNNVLFAIKDVYNSMASVSTARSLLCFGPPHQYQVPICFDLKLLKVLDALTIRFYEFPIGLLKLVLLRYLALTYNGKLPASISKLWNLEFLIIHRHMSIKFPGDLSYLPVEIWDMKELKHLQIMGNNLPDGPNSGTILEKLSTLSDVRAESCTKSILERTPNLVKLGILIELAHDGSEPLFSFDGISQLERLESLKCVIVNPELKSKVVLPHALFSMLPSGLNKLSLSGFGYAWEDMRPIALLPKLQELKLKCFAFHGPEWVMREGEFNSLCYLLLEDTDLVQWKADDYCHLQSLQLLIIRHCCKLKKIPWQCLPRSCKTELVDCNPSASERMPENYLARFYSSWEGGEP